MEAEGPVSALTEELHHYTDWSGLEGIFKSQQLHGTRFDCLNDRNEVAHLCPKLIELLTPKLRDYIRDRRRKDRAFAKSFRAAENAFDIARVEARLRVESLWESAFQKTPRSDAMFAPFIVSFCSHHGDTSYERKHGLLSQWRGYGGTEGRFAIVFDTFKLEALLKAEAAAFRFHSLHFADAIYDLGDLACRADVKLLVGLIFDYAVEIAESGSEDRSLAILEEMLTPLLQLSTRIKHRGFLEEREVRIIAMPVLRQHAELAGEPLHHPKSPEAKTAPSGMTRHFLRLFDELKGVRLPIRRIIVGPHWDQVALAEKVMQLTKGAIRVVKSDTPFLG